MRSRSTPGLPPVWWALQISLHVLTADAGLAVMSEKPPIPVFRNIPNPFNPETDIRFSVPDDGMVDLRIFNNLGEEVRSLVSDHYTPGEYGVRWNGRDNAGRTLASGIYFARLVTPGSVQTLKMLMLK